MPPPLPTLGNRHALFDIYAYSEKRNVPLHRHLFYELIFLRSGNASLDYRGKSVRFEAHQIHICPPKEAHALQAISGTFENTTIAFYPGLFRLDPPVRPPMGWPARGPDHPLAILRELVDRDSPTLDLSPAAVSRLQDLIEIMREEFRLQLPGYLRQLSIYAQETFILLLRESRGISAHPFSRRTPAAHPLAGTKGVPTQSPELYQNHHVAKVIRWMRENLAIRPNMKGYAKLLGLQEKYLTTLFTNTVGVSPQRYHTRLRLEEAARHLVNTTRPIEEISCRFGFPSRSHFSRQFRQYFRTSPGVYRYTQRLPASDVQS